MSALVRLPLALLGGPASCVTLAYGESFSWPMAGVSVLSLPSSWSAVHTGDAAGPWLGASPDGHPAPAYARLHLPPHLRGVNCAVRPGLGCVLWAAGGSFDLSSLMWRLSAGPGRCPRQWCLCEPCPGTSAHRNLWAQNCLLGGSSRREKGNNELVMFRMKQGLGGSWHWWVEGRPTQVPC